MRNVLVVSVVSVVALCGSGCITIGAAQPASTMGKGNVNGGVEANVWGYSTGNGIGIPPSVSGVIRFGVSDHVDLGVRLGLNGAELQGKFMLTDPNSERFVFSLAAMAQGFFFPQLTGVNTSTPNFGSLAFPVVAMFGIKLGNHELVFGARETSQLYFTRDAFPGAPTTQIFAVNLGVSAGIALRLGESFIMMPELALQGPVWASARNLFGNANEFNTPLVRFTAGMSFIFGKMKPRQNLPPPPVEYERQPPPPAYDEGDPTPPPLPPDVAPVPPPPPPPPPES
ncbi:MAG: hypothetical protein JNK82_38685 [Myxococcaceae bacterium]|nr:hypothetical protein [Myxococcaceae bacterium]